MESTKDKLRQKLVKWLNSSLIWRSSRVLDRSDRSKAIFISLAYAFMGLLDVIAVFAFGIVGSLAVSGFASNKPGNRVSLILNVLNLENATLQVQVAYIGIGASIVLIFKSILSLYLTRQIFLFLGRRSAFISQRLVRRLLTEDIVSLREKTIQETIYALTSGVNTVVVGIFGSALLLVSDFFLLFIFGFTLFLVDTTVALSSLAFFAVLGIVLFRVMHSKARLLGEQSTRIGIESNNKIAEVVSCYRELLVKDRREFYAEEIGNMRYKIAEAGANLSIMGLVSKYIMEISMVLGGLFIGALQFLTQPATRAVAVISVFLVASARIVPGVLRVQTGLVGIKTATATALPTIELIERYFNLEKPKSTDRQLINEFPKKFDYKGFIPHIEIRGLHFKYPSRKRAAISELSLTINSGEFVGIVGPSGSGKSTLVDLILGVLKLETGKIEISGERPLEALKRWPGAIGYVPQDANFINGTVKDNICLGFKTEQVPDDTVNRIVKSVQLDEILKLSEGIHTPIGERGAKLSGGQRQRLGIARALLTDPQLLILDEATSSLDSITESLLTDYFETLKGKLTLVVVAHRLSTILNADKIIYIEQGILKGVGNFKQLRRTLPEFEKQATMMGIN